MESKKYSSGNSSMKPWIDLDSMGRTLELKAGTIFYYDSGSAGQDQPESASKPLLILIHGLGDEADTWRHLIPLFCKKGYRIIAPDLPGFGRSTAGELPWKERITVNCHVKAVLSLVQSTGSVNPGNPAILIGSSMGAYIVQMAAFRLPDLFKSLILLDGCYPISGNLDKNLLLMGLPFIGRAWYRGFQKDHDAAWKSLYPYYNNLEAMANADREFLRQRVIDRVESKSQEQAYFASLRSMIRLHLSAKNKFTRDTRNFPGNFFVLWGESDRIMPLERAAAFRICRPDADFQIISGVGHLPHQEAPEKTADAILNFLEKN